MKTWECGLSPDCGESGAGSGNVWVQIKTGTKHKHLEQDLEKS